MLIEQIAYSNRWQQVHPAAKLLFAAFGMTAAFMATSLPEGGTVALLMLLTTVMGGGVPFTQYIKVAAPPLFFLLSSVLVVAFSFDSGFHLTPGSLEQAARLCSRALAALTSLQFLAMTTPMNQVISLLQRAKVPDILLDLVVIAYRMLSVLLDTMHGIRTAQGSRLGYSSYRASLRSLGLLTGNLMVQTLYRSSELHHAAISRNSCGPLIFLQSRFANPWRDISIAVFSGLAMLALILLLK